MKRHPAKRALREWSAGRRQDLDSHIESCSTCMGVLDEMTGLDAQMRTALRHITRPEPGLIERLDHVVLQRRKRAEDLGAALDLFSLGWRTIDTLVDRDD